VNEEVDRGNTVTRTTAARNVRGNKVHCENLSELPSPLQAKDHGESCSQKKAMDKECQLRGGATRAKAKRLQGVSAGYPDRGSRRNLLEDLPRHEVEEVRGLLQRVISGST